MLGEGDDTPETDSSGKITDVVLVTHDSFSLPKRLIAKFESDTGYHLVVRASGDAGELTSKLVLTKDSPTGDAAFGVDNSFAGRALGEEVFAPYDGELPAGADAFELDSDTAHTLAPIDTSEVCVNVDTGVVRGPQDAAAGHPRRPDRPDVRGPVRDPRCPDQLARFRVPARHDLCVRRRLAGLLGET